MSMSGGWFFVVASEAISVGHTTITLPGIGSYIALAIEERNLVGDRLGDLAMLIVILIYDQLLFRPLVAWADRFRSEQEAGVAPPRSWVLDVLRRSRVLALRSGPLAALMPAGRSRSRAAEARGGCPNSAQSRRRRGPISCWRSRCRASLLGALADRGLRGAGLSSADVLHVVALALLTLLRVVVLIALATLMWVPVASGSACARAGARRAAAGAIPAAFPANLFFPIAVFAIVALKLNPDIWLCPLMILGTQWYILFNVIAGAAAIPCELRYVGANMQLRGWLWWRSRAARRCSRTMSPARSRPPAARGTPASSPNM